MKEKNNGAKKVLLMAISCALVAAISVGATLAYLTAKTEEKVNKFSASPGCTGKVLEPNFDEDQTYTVVPGVTQEKDPLIQNTTAGDDIIVGAKLSFYIKVDPNAADYTKVTAKKFQNYVTIDWNVLGTNGSTGFTGGALSATGDSNKWKEIPSTEANTYFIYDGILANYQRGTSESESTNDIPESTEEKKTTMYDKYGGDNTFPIFTSVTPDKAIKILPDYSGTYNKTIDGTINDVYECFDYKIVIEGYGVKDDGITVTGSTSAEKIGGVESHILEKLGGSNH